ncbi:hypothetical protein EDB85DRAFT_537384 [Lactarius pseudohatsudake]|nr:hypothetical protein EDB85DRAFT_537384 [Lactarius pseudohatsudake]
MQPSTWGGIADILSRLTSQPYVTQEVIWSEGQPVTPDLYTGNDDVQETRVHWTCIRLRMRTHWPPSSPSRILTAGFLSSRATATSSTRMLELPTRVRGAAMASTV